MGCWTRFETEVPGLRGQITTSKFMCQALAVYHNFSSDEGLAKCQPFSSCYDLQLSHYTLETTHPIWIACLFF